MKKLMMVALCALGANVALADPSVTVTINKVESVYPWKGAISVEYTLDGLDSGFKYRVAFEITADGQTAVVTYAAAQLENQSYTKTIDTAALFGKEVVTKNANVQITLIALPIDALPGIQLWEDGPIWAESDAASWKNWYDAQNAVSEPWRLPTEDEFRKLIDTSVCTRQYDGTETRWTFTGVGKYEVNSISLDDYPGYWSSTERDSRYAIILDIFLCVEAGDKDGEVYKVRAVRDATELDVATVVATAAAEFWLGPTPGAEGNPWTVGDGVTAYIKDGTVFVNGSGAVTSTPWVDEAAGITKLQVGEGVMKLGGTMATLPNLTSVNGLTMSALGDLVVIPDDKVLVAKEELQAANAETVSVADGVVTLGVTVNTNGNFTAETKDWKPVELTENNVEVKDGRIVISIPVSGDSGFMILQSGDAKVQADELKLSGGTVFTGGD